MDCYHQIKKLGPEMKNIEEKEERHDVVKKQSYNRDARNRRNNLNTDGGIN